MLNGLEDMFQTTAHLRREYEKYLDQIKVLHLPYHEPVDGSQLTESQAVDAVPSTALNVYKRLLRDVPQQSTTIELMLFAVLEQVVINQCVLKKEINFFSSKSLMPCTSIITETLKVYKSVTAYVYEDLTGI